MPGLHPILTGEVLHNTYVLERVIGKGAMGVVYEASHLRLSRKFAVKVVQPSVAADTEALERFRREAEIASKLGHPHIIEIIDFNTTPEGIAYIVMELLRGESLQARLNRTRSLEVEQVGAILEQTASALQVAHNQGIIHRDLKPENVFLCEEVGGETDFVKVLDFGMSKMFGLHRLTGTNVILGTPWFMSPEQAEGRSSEADTGSDQFALGAMLYMMLAGRMPFPGKTVDAVLYEVVNVTPPSLREIRPEIPQAVERVVARAMSKRPEDRYASVGELSSALERALTDPDELIMTDPWAPELPSTAGATLPELVHRLGVTEPPALGVTEPPGPALGVTEPPESSPASLVVTRPRDASLVVTKPREPSLAGPQAPIAEPPRARWAGLLAALAVVVIGAGVHLWQRGDGGTPALHPPLDAALRDRSVRPVGDTSIDQAREARAAGDDAAPAQLKTRPPSVARKGTRPAHAIVPESGTGTLSIAARHGETVVLGAKVFINRDLKGHTPKRITLPVGRYLLQVEKPGYKTSSQRVTVRKDKVRLITVDLGK